MHPVLHRLIFLTMALGNDLTGDEKAKADIKKRLAYIDRVDPEMVTLSFGEDADSVQVWNGKEWVNFTLYFETEPRYGANGKVEGWEVVIDGKWIDLYWGLWTNATSKPFTKWFNDYNKRTLELIEAGRL
jgi:hypothetical protein